MRGVYVLQCPFDNGSGKLHPETGNRLLLFLGPVLLQSKGGLAPDSMVSKGKTRERKAEKGSWTRMRRTRRQNNRIKLAEIADIQHVIATKRVGSDSDEALLYLCQEELAYREGKQTSWE